MVLLFLGACDANRRSASADAALSDAAAAAAAVVQDATETGSVDVSPSAEADGGLGKACDGACPSNPTGDVDSGICKACDSTSPSNPTVDMDGGAGNITTYGNVLEPESSNGGACNYGNTHIKYYAAINVNVASGDSRGQWQAGKICGQCALVRAKTPDGWKEVAVRITDKCADQYCGIDLGGAPARELMGSQPGRYQGSWRFISCDGYKGVSDGAPTIFVKEGSNAWWALIQVRNPPAAVLAIDWSGVDGGREGTFAYATEAENFYSVPEEVRTSSGIVHLTIRYRDTSSQTLDIDGAALTKAGALYAL